MRSEGDQTIIRIANLSDKLAQGRRIRRGAGCSRKRCAEGPARRAVESGGARVGKGGLADYVPVNVFAAHGVRAGCFLRDERDALNWSTSGAGWSFSELEGPGDRF